MGQMRSKRCPVCDRSHDGKWTCPDCQGTVNIHRELLRNLQRWHVSYLQGDVPDVISQGGESYCLWDIITIFENRHRLAEGQSRAIELCLYHNVSEPDAAEIMGISRKSPVSIYATVGIARLLGMARRGEIARYKPDREGAA